jgi:hypothetical protein
MNLIIFGVFPFAIACVATGSICTNGNDGKNLYKLWTWKLPRVLLIWTVFGGYAFVALKIADHASRY